MQDLSNEAVLHVKNGEAEYIQFRKLLEYKELKHAISLKPLNFFSNAEYENNKAEAMKHYQILCDCLELDVHQLIRPKQTHTDCIRIVSQKEVGVFPQELDDVDGMITSQKNLVLSLVFADCIPLLFFDPVEKVIANVHSGWKGTVQKIGKKAVNRMMQKYHCHPQNILCCIGPSIGKCHFEVGEEVFEIFKGAFKDLKSLFNMIQKRNDIQGEKKYNIDTVAINRAVLEEMGLLPENIIESNICTVCHSKITHSYRADKEMSGRATAIICLNE